MNPAPLAGLTGIARRLVAEGALSEGEARKAVDDALRQKIPIGAWLVENSLVGSNQVALASSAEFGIPLFDIQALDLVQIPLRLVREDLISKHKALPQEHTFVACELALTAQARAMRVGAAQKEPAHA